MARLPRIASRARADASPDVVSQVERTTVRLVLVISSGDDSERLARHDLAAVVELPLACTLVADEGAARMDLWQRLVGTATPSAHRAGHRLEVRYEPGPGVREELQALAEAEATCCSFVAWAVTQDGDHPILHVTADPRTPDDVAPIAALFGLT